MKVINKPIEEGTWLPWLDEEGGRTHCPKDSSLRIVSSRCNPSCLHFVKDEYKRNRTLCTYKKV